jgi:hypothetical protein
VNRFPKWFPFVAGAVLLASVACSTSSTSSTRITQLRAVNIAPTAPTLDLLIDNKTIFSSMAYGVPTAFATVTAINHDLKLFDPAASTDLLDNPTEPFTAGATYTYLVIGDQSSATGIKGNKLTDDVTAPDKGNFKLRIVNGSPTLGPIDVYILDPAAPAYTTAKPAVGGLAANTASAYQSLPSGSYQIFITRAGDNSCLQVASPQIPTTCLVNLNGLNGTSVPGFQAGQNRTLIMVNQIPGGGTYTTLPLLADLN